MKPLIFQAYADARRPDAVADHDPTHPVFVQFRWTAGARSTGYFVNTTRPYPPDGYILPNPDLSWRGYPQSRLFLLS